MADTYTGTVTKSELRIFDHPRPSPYRQFSTQKQATLLVAMDTPAGPIWFYSPPANYNITCPPGAPIAVCTVHESDWIGQQPVDGTQSNVLGHQPVAKIQAGQTLTIQGRIKGNTRYGRQLNYVKLID